MSGKGHNSSDDKLRLLVERIERLAEEKDDLATDIAAVYAEAKAVGYNTKIVREIVKFRKMKPDDLQERNSLLQIYGSALGLDLL